MTNLEKQKERDDFNNNYKPRNLKEGSIYISNNPCFQKQVFKITEIGDVEFRFQRKNRIVEYERYAFVAFSTWIKIEDNKSWETNSGVSIFGDEIPKNFMNELK